MSKEKPNESIRVTITSIGRGLTLTLPGLNDTEIQSLKSLYPDDKFQPLESIKTAWLTPFLHFVRLSHEGELVRAHTSLRFSPELECVRCLEIFRAELLPESSALFIDEARMPRPMAAEKIEISRKEPNFKRTI